MKKKQILFLFIFLSLFSCVSNDDMYYFDFAPLMGVVYDSDNRPCSNVKIVSVLQDYTPFEKELYKSRMRVIPTIEKKEQATLSSLEGRFALPEVRRGRQLITAEKEKHETVTIEVNFFQRTQLVYIRMTSSSQLLDQAEKKTADRRYYESNELLDRALAIDSTNMALSYLKAINFYQLEKYPETLAILSEIREEEKNNPWVALFLADFYQYKQNDPQKALLELKIYLSRIGSQKIQKRYDALLTEIDKKEKKDEDSKKD